MDFRLKNVISREQANRIQRESIKNFFSSNYGSRNRAPKYKRIRMQGAPIVSLPSVDFAFTFNKESNDGWSISGLDDLTDYYLKLGDNLLSTSEIGANTFENYVFNNKKAVEIKGNNTLVLSFESGNADFSGTEYYLWLELSLNGTQYVNEEIYNSGSVLSVDYITVKEVGNLISIEITIPSDINILETFNAELTINSTGS